jgi:DNA polymerase
VDAREQLRRYLEQRRELGESELVLDGMTVEEALTIVTGKTARTKLSVEASIQQAPAPAADAAEAPVEIGHDWRETLRAAGAAPGLPKRPASPRDANHEPTDVADREPRPPSTESLPADAAPVSVPSGLSVGTPAGELFGGAFSQLDSLAAVAAVVATCTRCPLYSTATNPVPGEGKPNAELMLVGEAPGATEDETGRPFVGAAGQLLTKILAAIELAREDVFICNVLKHRPPGNRNPRPEEVTACSPYLVRQIELIRPKAIIALGTFAAQTLLDTKLSIGKLRGQIHRYFGVPLVVTYHPAALLRNPSWKRPTWDDVKLARRILDSAPTSGA